MVAPDTHGAESLQQLRGAKFFDYGAAVVNGVGISDSFVTQMIFRVVDACIFSGPFSIKIGRAHV